MLYIVAHDLSACLTHVLLLSHTLLSPKLAAGPAARAQFVALRPHTPSFHHKFADTDAPSSAKPAPTSHATTLPVMSEELQHR